MIVSGHYAAGVLPFTRLSDGRVLFLVGEDVRDCSFSDFGGKAEGVDMCNSELTAARECMEETFGLLLTDVQMRNVFAAQNFTLIHGKTRAGYPYFCYVIEVPFMPALPSMARKLIGYLRTKHLYKSLVEKTSFRWVTTEELFSQHLRKRPVFTETITQNRAKLEALAAN